MKKDNLGNLIKKVLREQTQTAALQAPPVTLQEPQRPQVYKGKEQYSAALDDLLIGKNSERGKFQYQPLFTMIAQTLVYEFLSQSSTKALNAFNNFESQQGKLNDIEFETNEGGYDEMDRYLGELFRLVTGAPFVQAGGAQEPTQLLSTKQAAKQKFGEQVMQAVDQIVGMFVTGMYFKKTPGNMMTQISKVTGIGGTQNIQPLQYRGNDQQVAKPLQENKTKRKITLKESELKKLIKNVILMEQRKSLNSVEDFANAAKLQNLQQLSDLVNTDIFAVQKQTNNYPQELGQLSDNITTIFFGIVIEEIWQNELQNNTMAPNVKQLSNPEDDIEPIFSRLYKPMTFDNPGSVSKSRNYKQVSSAIQNIVNQGKQATSEIMNDFLDQLKNVNINSQYVSSIFFKLNGMIMGRIYSLYAQGKHDYKGTRPVGNKLAQQNRPNPLQPAEPTLQQPMAKPLQESKKKPTKGTGTKKEQPKGGKKKLHEQSDEFSQWGGAMVDYNTTPEQTSSEILNAKQKVNDFLTFVNTYTKSNPASNTQNVDQLKMRINNYILPFLNNSNRFDMRSKDVYLMARYISKLFQPKSGDRYTPEDFAYKTIPPSLIDRTTSWNKLANNMQGWEEAGKSFTNTNDNQTNTEPTQAEKDELQGVLNPGSKQMTKQLKEDVDKMKDMMKKIIK